MQIMHHNADPVVSSALPLSSDTVFILLSTYNGEKYLTEQLLSLEQQSFSNWVVLWRDDGSTDTTPLLMKNFSLKHGAARCRPLEPDNGKRLGVLNSYLRLLQAVPAGAFVSFCDQDDIWLPDKISSGLTALKTVSDNIPALYCCRQILTNSKLQTIGLSPALPASPVFLSAITQNIATGCTVMLSPAACDILKNAPPPPPHTLHDWWAYLLISAAGGRIITDNTPHFLYRQHESNVVGARASFLNRALAALRRGPQAFMTLFYDNITALLQCRRYITDENFNSLLILHNSLQPGWGSIITRFFVLCRLRQLRRNTKSEQLIFCIWFLAGRYKSAAAKGIK